MRRIALALALALAGCHHSDHGSAANPRVPQPDFAARTHHVTPRAMAARVPTSPAKRDIAPTSWVFFKTGSEMLSAQAQQDLDQIADWLNAHPDQRILVEGHTDSSGSPSFNLRLSFRRAAAVAEYLASRGVSRARIAIDPQGALHAARNPIAGDRRAILYATIPAETGLQ